ncbi:enoyl-CoA hydratase [Gordonia sp. DT218]|uniref:enoyl-CoA hydratase n=1 Tax=unclassified Gordonia (in: high G+C Gram-positive bacteria) TaxID=2657482 RepID=UPI003CEEF749
MSSKLRASMMIATVSVLTFVGAGIGTAAPLQSTTLGSDNFGTFGDHDYCHGVMNARLSPPKGKRGVVRVNLTSFGFTGSGAGWQRNPHCRVVMGTSHISSIAWNQEHFLPATFGSRKGEQVSRDIYTGSGLIQFGVVPYSKDLPVRVRQDMESASLWWFRE